METNSRVAPRRQDVAVEEPVDLPRGAQAVTLEMPRSPIGDYVAEGARPSQVSTAGLPAWTRLMASRAFSRASSTLMRSTGPMVAQTCLPVGVAGDGDEALGPARLDADVMAGNSGSGCA